MRQSLAIGFLLATALHVAPLEAATFTVNPMQVVFTPARKSAVVTLKNTSKDEIRFQIRVFTWDQSPRGDMQLGETKDVVFFPQLLVLGPGQQRPIRLGITGSVDSVEKAYRIFFEELPAGERPVQATANGVQMRIKVGLPIFVSPTNRGTATVQTHNPRLAGGKVALAVENSGISHVVIDAVRVRGLDAGGQRLFERGIKGWYLLAKHTSEYEVPLNSGDCTAASLAVEVLVGSSVLRDRIEGPLTGCR